MRALRGRRATRVWPAQRPSEGSLSAGCRPGAAGAITTTAATTATTATTATFSTIVGHLLLHHHHPLAPPPTPSSRSPSPLPPPPVFSPVSSYSMPSTQLSTVAFVLAVTFALTTATTSGPAAVGRRCRFSPPPRYARYLRIFSDYFFLKWNTFCPFVNRGQTTPLWPVWGGLRGGLRLATHHLV